MGGFLKVQAKDPFQRVSMDYSLTNKFERLVAFLKSEVSKGSALAGFIQKIRNKKIRMCQF